MRTQKNYSIEHSPLYAVASNKKLATVLCGTSKDLRALEKKPIFAVFSMDGREIQEPKGIQRRIHDRIQSLFARIATPDFVYSGKRGVCYIDNARQHVRNTDLMAVDIHGFYRHTRKEYVFRFFHYQMKMPNDLAHLMSNVCCYRDVIPTGSPLSQALAYWAYRPMFDRIAALALENSMTFTLYVDDMTFSRMTPIPQSFHLEVEAILKAYRLHLKRKKSEYWGKTQYKRVTGCIIAPDKRLLVPNWQRLKIRELVQGITADKDDFDFTQYQSALGSIASARQIEPQIFSDSQRSLKSTYKARVHPKLT